MSFIVSTPKPKHSCHPGWVERNGYFDNFGAHVPAGTVVGCACGKTYVAYYDFRSSYGYVSLAAKWRLESRIKRWLRERRTESNRIKQEVAGRGIEIVPFQEMPEGWEPPPAPLLISNKPPTEIPQPPSPRLNLDYPKVDEF